MERESSSSSTLKASCTVRKDLDGSDGRLLKPLPCPSLSSSDGVGEAAVFFGIFIPADAVEDTNDTSAASNACAGQELQLVYSDKQAALTVVKKYRGARFKAFRSRAEAVHFSKYPAEASALVSSAPSSSSSTESDFTSAENASLERGTTFRGPKSQELVRLRKAIEIGDADFFMQTVWANPRYLISNSDTPTILQEGPRYNALHVVAKAKQSAMCRFVLDTIEDVALMRLLYNDDSPKTRLRRVNFLVDFYINMPDKGLCETPLHFASKFGCIEIVEMLASHPACVRNVPNKYQQTPRDVICTRCTASSSELKRQIEEALEDQCFVPVLGAADNCLQPYIGEPWSPCKLRPDNVERNHVLNSTPFVRAYAGPMSPKKAEELRSRWKTPPSCTTNSSRMGRDRLMGIRLSDSDKGLERIGRELARDLDFPWVEYWSFLDAYCDLSKPEGLNQFETYLRTEYNRRTSAAVKYDISSLDVSVIDPFGKNDSVSFGSSVCEDNKPQSSSSSSDGSLCQMISMLTLNSNGVSPATPPPPPLVAYRAPIQRSKAEEENCDCDPVPKLSSGSRTEIVLEHVCRDLAIKVTNEASEQAARNDGQEYLGGPPLMKREFLEKIKPSFECLMGLARNGSPLPDGTRPHVVVAGHIVRHLRDELFEEDILANIRNWTLNDGAATNVLSSDEESSEEDVNPYRRGSVVTGSVSFPVIRRHLMCILKQVMSLTNDRSWQNIDCTCDFSGGFAKPTFGSTQVNDSDDVCSDDSTSTDTYRTPPTSIVSSSHSSSMSDAKTPDEGLLLFMNGAEPTKLDVDVLRAVETVHIDPVSHPHITRWKHLVTSYSKEETETWPTPMSPRAARGDGVGFPSRPSDWTPSRLSAPDSMSSHLQHRLRIGAAEATVSTSSSFGGDICCSVQSNLYQNTFQNLAKE